MFVRKIMDENKTNCVKRDFVECLRNSDNYNDNDDDDDDDEDEEDEEEDKDENEEEEEECGKIVLLPYI